MNIQSSLNQLLGSAESITRLVYAGKELQKFGTGLSEAKESVASQAEATKELAKEQKKTSTEQSQYNRDIAKMLRAIREEKIAKQGEYAIMTKEMDEIIKRQSQQQAMTERKEYLRKPRVINRHGTVYQEVTKDGK